MTNTVESGPRPPPQARNGRRVLALLLAVAASAHAALASTSPDQWIKQRSPAESGSGNGTAAAAAAAPGTAPDGKTFEEVFDLALQRAESVSIENELFFQSDESHLQALEGFAPTIAGSTTSKLTTPNYTSPAQNAANAATITIDQPIFRGFRDFAGLRQRKAQREAARLAYQDAARQLFYNTAQAYYNLLASESDEANYRNEIEVNRKRLGDLENFYKIGRSQITDVLTQKSQISVLETILEATRGQVETAREVLAFFTGKERTLPLRDTEKVPLKPEPPETYLGHLEERTDVMGAVANVKAAEENVPLAWGNHLPSIDVLGDINLINPSMLSPNAWDVALGVSIPIFQGFTVVSQTRAAASLERQSNYVLSQTRRTAEQEIRTFYDSFRADQLQIAKFTETVEIARQNYEAEIKEYRNGLVTNLDVLTAITTWQDNVRQLAHQQFQARMDYVRLQAASGGRKEILIESQLVK